MVGFFFKQQQEISIMLQISLLKEFTKGPILRLLKSYKKIGLTGLGEYIKGFPSSKQTKVHQNEKKIHI